MRHLHRIGIIAVVACVAAPAYAGKGGSAAKIDAAVRSGSVDAIVAEVERAEGLMCEPCVDTLTRLTEDGRYRVREVAAWWFARRPGLQRALAEQFMAELETGDAIAVRNAADFLGGSRTFRALPQLRRAIRRTLTSEAKLAIVRAVDGLGNIGGDDVLTVAMADRDPAVRAAAIYAWRDLRGQRDAAPVVALLDDPDAHVRAVAATVIGGLVHVAAASRLEALVVSDPDPFVRKNAAWALGKLGAPSSAAALTRATHDPSGLVRMTARAALARLR